MPLHGEFSSCFLRMLSSIITFYMILLESPTHRTACKTVDHSYSNYRYTAGVTAEFLVLKVADFDVKALLSNKSYKS